MKVIVVSSDIHTIAYSLICLQEMNLNYFYPSVYWATAVITVDAGALDNNEDGSNTNYAKVASAIGRVQTEGYRVELPSVNRAKFGFIPNAKENSIVYGLKGISGVGDDFAKEIIDKRPYVSVEDFLEKTQPQKKQMISLIKAGAFEEFGDRREIMNNYLASITPQKARITLQNMNSLIEYNLIPKDLISYVYLFNFNKYLKRYEVPEGYKLDKRAMEFLIKNYPDIDISTGFLDTKIWKKIYESGISGIKTWMKDNEEELKRQIQKAEIQNIWRQYCEGSNSAWEMEVLGFYYSGHELANVQEGNTDIKTLKDGNYKTSVSIYGTVLGKDAYKHMVTLLTTTGVINLKFANEMFAKYNKVISEMTNEGKKTLEKSWFNKGTLLIVNGHKSGEVFRVKSLAKIVDIDNFGNIKSTKYRYGEA